MANKEVQIKQKTANGSDILYPVTKASLVADCVTTNTAQTISDTKTFSASPTLANNVFLKGTTSANTIQNLIGIDSLNVVKIGYNKTENIYSYQGLSPAVSSRNLGDTTNKWQHLYLSGKVNVAGSGSMWDGTIYDTVSGSFIGFNASGQIGFKSATTTSPANAFAFRVGDTNVFRVGNGGIRPEGNNLYDNGTSDYKWKDLYVAGSLKDGTNSISIANIATKNDIGTGTLTLKVGNTTVGSFSANASSNTTLTVSKSDLGITASDLGITAPMQFKGATLTELTDESTTATINVAGTNVTLTSSDAGAVYTYGNKEFVWTGSKWEVLGDEGSYQLKVPALGSTTKPVYTSANGTFAECVDIPTSIDGLGGGTLTSRLVLTGGDAVSGVANLQLDTNGQITAKDTTSTLFGRSNSTTLLVGHSSHALNLRGSATRPTYNSNSLALYSDIPAIKKGTSASQSSNTTNVATLRFGFDSGNGILYIWTS